MSRKRQRRITRRQFVGRALSVAGAVAFAAPAIAAGPQPQRQAEHRRSSAPAAAAAPTSTASRGENIVALCDVTRPRCDKLAAEKHPQARRSDADFRKLFDDTEGVRRRGGEHLRAHARLRHAAGARAGQARLLREAADLQHLGSPRHPRGGGEGEGRHADGHADSRRRQLPPRGRTDPERRDRPGARGPRLGVAGVGLAERRGRRANTRTSSSCASGRRRRTPVPAGLDWDLWLGPAPERPFNEVYYPGPKWYRWWDFGNGTMSDLGSHWNDLPFWALKLQSAADHRGAAGRRRIPRSPRPRCRRPTSTARAANCRR